MMIWVLSKSFSFPFLKSHLIGNVRASMEKKKMNLMCVNQSSALRDTAWKEKKNCLVMNYWMENKMMPLKRINPTGNHSKGEKASEREVATKTAFSLLNGSLLLKSKILLCCFLICMKLFTTFLCQHGENTGRGKVRGIVRVEKTNNKKKKRAMSKTAWGTAKRRRGELLKLRLWMWIDSSILTIAPCRLSAVNLTYDWFPWSVCMCVRVVVCVKWAASLDHLLPLAAPATIRCVTWKRIPAKSFRSS